MPTKRADGRYQVKRGNKFFYGTTQKEAEAKRRAYDLEVAQGLRHQDTGLTIKDYADKWLPVHRHGCCKKSYGTYKNVLGNFSDMLENMRVKDVTKTDIIAYYNTLDGKSKSYIDKARTTIKGLFSSAVEDGVIIKNPCTGAKRTFDRQKREKVPLSQKGPINFCQQICFYIC